MKKYYEYLHILIERGLFALIVTNVIFVILGKYIIPEIIDYIMTVIASVSGVDVILVDTIEFTFTNPVSLLLYVLIFFIISISLILEYAVLIIVSALIYFNKKVSFKSVLSELKMIKRRLFSMKVFAAFLIFYIMISVLGIGLDTHIIAPIILSKTITNYIYSSTVLNGILLLLRILLLIIVARYSLNIHNFILKDYTNKEFYVANVFNKNKIMILAMFILFALVQLSFVHINEYAINELLVDTLVNGIGFDLLELLFILLLFSVTLLKAIILPIFSLGLTIIYFKSFGVAIEASTKKRSTYKMVLGLLVLFLLSTNVFDIGVTTENKVMVHRAGGSEVLENTYESILYAVENGYDSVEIDVMFLKDGEIILYHDTNLQRLSKKNVNIYDLTLQEIKEIDLFDENGDVFTHVSLKEVFDIVNDDMFINIELKVHGHEDEDYLSKLVDLIKKYDKVSSVCVSTFEYDDLIEIEKIEEEIQTIVISYYFLGDVKKLKTDGIALDIKYISKALVNICRENNKSVFVWTANLPVDIAHALSIDSDYIITDNPDLLLDIKTVFDKLESFFSVF